MFFRPAHLYIKIKINKIWVKHLESQTSVELDAHERFTTERLLIGNFDVASSVTKAATKQVHSRRVVSPKMVIHPLEYLKGGLSPVEKRLFLDLAFCSGAREARVWEGIELTDEQIIELFRSKTPDRG